VQKTPMVDGNEVLLCRFYQRFYLQFWCLVCLHNSSRMGVTRVPNFLQHFVTSLVPAIVLY
jgi:hypothetical protein